MRLSSHGYSRTWESPLSVFLTPGLPQSLPEPLPKVLPFSVHEKCSSSEFQCENGQCISSSLHCDGNRDCLDHSDEESCPVTWSLQCPEGEMKCLKSGECVLAEWICDHDVDCKDGTDEKVAYLSFRNMQKDHCP